MPSLPISSMSRQHNQITSETQLPAAATVLSTNTKAINTIHPQPNTIAPRKPRTKPALPANDLMPTLGHPKSQSAANAIDDAAEATGGVSRGPFSSTFVHNTREKNFKTTRALVRASNTTSKARTSLKPTSSTTTTSTTFVNAPQTAAEPKSRVDRGVLKMCSGSLSGTSGLVKQFVEQMERGKTTASPVEFHSQGENNERRKGAKPEVLETNSEVKVRRVRNCVALPSVEYLTAQRRPECRGSSSGGNVCGHGIRSLVPRREACPPTTQSSSRKERSVYQEKCKHPASNSRRASTKTRQRARTR